VRVAEVTLGLSLLDEMPTLDLKKSRSRKHAHAPEKKSCKHPGIIIKLSELRMIVQL